MDKKNTEIINLKPVFIVPEEKNYNIINFNSFFLYLFLILEIVIIILILYFFFKKEVIFVYKNIFFNTDYTDEEKILYNLTMGNLKKTIEQTKECIFFPNFTYNNHKITNKYLPVYNKNSIMIALNDDLIYFNTEKECKNFLSI